MVAKAKKKTSKGKSQPCGKGYIAAGLKCHKKGGVKTAAKRVAKQAIKEVPAMKKRGLSGKEILIKQGLNLASEAQRALKAKTPKKSLSRKIPDIKTLAAIGIGSVAAYKAIQHNYQNNFPTSAAKALINSATVKTDVVPKDKKSITFNVGGFYGYAGDKEARKGEDYFDYKLKTEVLGTKDNPGGDHHIVKHRNLEFNPTPSPVGGAAGHVRDTFEHYRKILEPVITKGHNPEAVKLASEVLAYRSRYPDKELNLMGHSAGGMITHEASEILRVAGVEHKVVNLGTAHFGMTPPRDNQKTLALDSDLYLKTVPTGAKNKVTVKTGRKTSPKEHMVRAYMNDEGARNQMRELLKPKSTKTDAHRSHNDQIVGLQLAAQVCRDHGRPNAAIESKLERLYSAA